MEKKKLEYSPLWIPKEQWEQKDKQQGSRKGNQEF